MGLEGKVIQDLGITSGTSKAGNLWKKREILVETFGTYPRRVKITLFGDRADTIQAELGKSYAFSIDIESREFNGRYYTDVTTYASREIGDGGIPVPPAPAYQQPAYQQPVAPAAPAAPAADPFGASADSSDDLPF